MGVFEITLSKRIGMADLDSEDKTTMNDSQYRELKSKHYIQNLIEEGEHEHQDFKFQISDAKKIARSISAFANNDGGHLLIGVKDNGKIAGVRSEEEMFMIEQAAEMYCRPPQEVECSVYKVEGKSVLKVDIAKGNILPVKAPDENGNWKAYYRVADENIVASPLHVKIWKHRQSDRPTVFSLTEREQLLVDYVRTNDSITLEEYMRLAHITKNTAEFSVVNMCSMGALALQYRDGRCQIILPEGEL